MFNFGFAAVFISDSDLCAKSQKNTVSVHNKYQFLLLPICLLLLVYAANAFVYMFVTLLGFYLKKHANFKFLEKKLTKDTFVEVLRANTKGLQLKTQPTIVLQKLGEILLD